MHVSIFKYANNSHHFPDPPQNKLIHCFTLPEHTILQPPSHVPSSTPISSPTAPRIHPPRSSQDVLTLCLTTGPLLGSRLASWITEACCIPAAELGFPQGHIVEHYHCSEGLRSGSQPAQRCGRCTCPDKVLTSTWALPKTQPDKDQGFTAIKT